MAAYKCVFFFFFLPVISIKGNKVDVSFSIYAKLHQNTELREEKFNPEREQQNFKQFLTEQILKYALSSGKTK